MTGRAANEPTIFSEEELTHLRSWVGRQEVIEDTLAPMPAAALIAMLNHDDPPPRVGDPIPPLAHWLYFLPIHRQSDLAEDGHVRRGGFMPPVPLPRRMFAGATVTLHRPLHIGERARRVGTVERVTPKLGRTGPLVFVRVRQEISGEEGLAILEEQDIVYRAPPKAEEPARPDLTAPPEAAWSRRIDADNRLLFRYSALLFNAHRIHYDRRYATEVEGYPGLVVHGQLVATCLADLAMRNTGKRLTSFSFQARRAIFDGAPFEVAGAPCERGVRLWATNSTGAFAMDARAELSCEEWRP